VVFANGVDGGHRHPGYPAGGFDQCRQICPDMPSRTEEYRHNNDALDTLATSSWQALTRSGDIESRNASDTGPG
jgi:hypothetical protein